MLREGPLHASIKDWCARPGDRAEVRIERWVIDLVRADGELVEVQTGGFGPLGPKLDALLDGHRMRIVHPVPAERRILRVDDDGEVVRERRSPRMPGAAIAVLDKLVAFPSLLAHPHLTVEVLLCQKAPRPPHRNPFGARRRGRDPGQELVEVLDSISTRSPRRRAGAAARVAAQRALPPRRTSSRVRCSARARSRAALHLPLGGRACHRRPPNRRRAPLYEVVA